MASRPFCSALTLVQSLIALTVQTHSDLGSRGNIEFYINQYYVPNTLLLPGTPGKIIKRLARSSLPHHFFLRWELRAELKNVLFSFFLLRWWGTKTNNVLFCRVIWGHLHFHYSQCITGGHVTSTDIMKLVLLDLFFRAKCHPLPYSSASAALMPMSKLTRCY